MKIVSVINLKGGCAKTTTAVSMAELLAEGDKRRKRPGSRVLLFDNDKQGNTSRMFEVYNRDKEAEACRIMRTGHMEEMILSILVDTLFARISMPKQQYPEIHNISAA